MSPVFCSYCNERHRAGYPPGLLPQPQTQLPTQTRYYHSGISSLSAPSRDHHDRNQLALSRGPPTRAPGAFLPAQSTSLGHRSRIACGNSAARARSRLAGLAAGKIGRNARPFSFPRSLDVYDVIANFGGEHDARRRVSSSALSLPPCLYRHSQRSVPPE